MKQKTPPLSEANCFYFPVRRPFRLKKAVEYANLVWKMLKVRPAFLLGVIREESNLGANVGKGNWKEDLYNCYIKLGHKTSAEKQKTAF